jgi:CheY-like chemotaxis protein
MPQRPEILVVDDDAVVRRAIQFLLRGHGYQVRAYPNASALIGDTEARHAALLLADDRLPLPMRIDLLRSLRADGWAGTAMLMTRQESEDTAARARAAGFQGMLGKPLRPSILLGEAAAARDRALPQAG